MDLTLYLKVTICATLGKELHGWRRKERKKTGEKNIQGHALFKTTFKDMVIAYDEVLTG